jgi:hypothetical protein
MSLADFNIPESVIALIPESVARENDIIAINCSPDSLTIACPDESFGAIDEERIRFILNRPITWEIHTRPDIQSAINRHYGMSGGVENCEWEFRYRCPHRWQNFATTDDKMIRYCPVCARNVYLCADDASVIRHARLGHCIAKEDSFGLEMIGDVDVGKKYENYLDP